MKLKRIFAALLVAGLGLALVSPAAADYWSGLLAAKKQDYATAFREFRTLALKGHAPSQFNLALMYPLAAASRKITPRPANGTPYRPSAAISAP